MVRETILILEDEKKICSLIGASLLKQYYEVIITNGEKDILQTISKYHVDVVIIDSGCTHLERIESRLNEYDRQVPLIYMNCLPGLEIIISGTNLKRKSYLVETFDVDKLLNRIKLLLNETKVENKLKKKEGDMFEPLTPQEERILGLLEKGHTNKEIAVELGLMEATIRTYNYTLFQKLQVKNRTQAIVVAKEANLF